MEWMLLAKAAFALVLVVSLIGLSAALARKFNLQERLQGLGAGASGRLRVKESIMLGTGRRLVIVQCDGSEHLILLSPHGDVVVERGINNHGSGIGKGNLK